MKTYFCVSDIHGFYDELVEALVQAGFEYLNPDHILIVCGDIFDRGSQTLDVYKFLRELPVERRILIRGNHETLLKDLVKRGYPKSHDDHNGTNDTLCHIAKILTDREYNIKRFCELANGDDIRSEKNMDEVNKRQHKKFHNRKLNEILKWLDSDEWVNYYELGKYIFVHSFIPLKVKEIPETKWIRYYASYDVDPRYLEPVADWRSITDLNDQYWEDARWGCPWRFFKAGLFDSEIKNGKILVCGHWHASDFWNHLEDMNLDTYGENPMYKSEKYPNIIALDACTVMSGRVNVLVIKENEI